MNFGENSMGAESQTRRLQRSIHFCGNAQITPVQMSAIAEKCRERKENRSSLL